MEKSIFLLTLVLMGCTAHTSVNSALSYADKVTEAVGTNFPNAGDYTGKKCTLRVSLAQNGDLQNVNSEGGGPQLCAAAIEAVKETQFPAMTAEQYQLFKNVLLDFMP